MAKRRRSFLKQLHEALDPSVRPVPLEGGVVRGPLDLLRLRPSSAEERAVLRRGGASDEELDHGTELVAAARLESQKKHRALLKTCLDVEAAARLLKLSPGRIRQRLLDRTLYGFKLGTAWRIPAFQFLGRRRGLVPGIETVVSRLPPELPLLAVYNWFNIPNPDLRTDAEEDEGFTPLHWLSSGHEPKAAAALAANL